MRRTPLRSVSPKRAARLAAEGPKPRKPIARKAAPSGGKARESSPAVATIKSLRNKADRLAAARCKLPGVCAASGHPGVAGGVRCSGRMEWAHLKSRGFLFLRHEPRNALCLCNSHHRYFTVHPDEWVAFCEALDPGVWAYLNALLNDRRDSRSPKRLRDVYADAIARDEAALARHRSENP